ncbi:Folate-dependent protein for Fe/S cluster synthesis/repair in oxidative stress [Roseibacterium elongatum DSM 19469]|uniref:Folate-dependent protein for Fe/S cluster synthesis/repair in oxidative stress n=1 Tax=Roseicyclus elongatus DSM 19469 TaxID=1294273 RepID=W8S1S7_9RHOB|nr:folate-binding protein YgfZ [Roseibacterium elongatum]AHM04132.1 Folate-dependent protein for Fe/S cluster synthesis/repair in oxidative stress [Roseibacterium elongatum DSM 19469]
MMGERAENRVVLRIAGSEREHFLHGLVTNDLGSPDDGLTYAALLTPQGKYLADFFLLNRGDDILLDVHADIAQALAQRLMMYKLRADVVIEDSGLPVARGLGAPPQGAWPDPRHPSLGWRAYGVEGDAPRIDWDAIRVAACIPETGIELIPDDTYILEAGFDRLAGVDHRKGCYVGQEVTARMKHKTELRKGLVTVTVAGSAPAGTAIVDADGRAVGTLYTQANGRGIAHLRYDRAKDGMVADTAKLSWNGEKPV